MFSVTYTCMFAHPLRKLHRLSPVWRETRFKRLTRIMYYVACKMKDSSITNALFILQKPCVAKADRNMSPLPSWIMLIAWYTNLHIGAKEIENSRIHSFLSFQVMTLFFHDNGKYFLLRNQKYLYIKNTNALMYQLGKILFILNVLRLKNSFIYEQNYFHCDPYHISSFFNLKGQGLNSCFAIQSKKNGSFPFFLYFYNRILDLLSLSI